MRRCPFCDISVGNAPHIYFCSDRTTDDRKEIKLLYLNFNFPLFSDRDYIVEQYITKCKSLPDIKKEFGIDFKSFIFLLDYYGIEKRSISKSSELISVKKYKSTCMSKYGVDNVSKCESVKNKKRSTFLENYGVDNIFKDISFKSWIMENNFAWNNLTKEENIERVKRQTISVKKYWNNLTDEQKNKIYHQYNGTSSLETKISEVLNFLSISYCTQFTLSGKIFDFRISNTNILIEVNGDYWHCNPNRYSVNESVKFPGGVKKVSDVWKKDNDKKLKAEKAGFVVIYIWEDEIKNSNDVSSLLINKINTIVFT